ncbi:MAG: hypothetical protein WBB98_04920 [Xanthobacteraceae bacterium]
MLSTVQTETTNTVARKRKAGGQVQADTHTARAASTNSVARKRGTSATIGTTTTKASRSSKLSRASGAGGQRTIDTQGADAASTNTRSRKASAADSRVVCETTAAVGTNSAAPRKQSSRAAKTGGKVTPRASSLTHPIQRTRAAPHSDGHLTLDAHSRCAVAPYAAYPLPAPQHDAIVRIYTNWRKRQALVKAMTKLSLQAQAVLRFGRDREEAAKHYAAVAKNPAHEDYIDIVPYLESMAALEKFRIGHEKVLVQTIKTLPIYAWAKNVSGLGEMSLAGLVGECSGVNADTEEWWSIGQMKTVSAVWKRLGVAVMSGNRQGDATAGLSKADWVEHGYVKTRRSVLWNVGECVVKAQWRRENTVHAYGKFYGEEKARIQALSDSGAYAEAAARIVERMKKAGSKPLAENVAGRLTPSHINNRAKRHMTKQLIQDLFIEWRRLDALARGETYAPVAEAA